MYRLVLLLLDTDIQVGICVLVALNMYIHSTCIDEFVVRYYAGRVVVVYNVYLSLSLSLSFHLT